MTYAYTGDVTHGAVGCADVLVGVRLRRLLHVEERVLNDTDARPDGAVVTGGCRRQCAEGQPQSSGAGEDDAE
jgi:hypothetical protein